MATQPTIEYSAKTGQRLKAGEQTTDALGNVFTQGQVYTPPTSIIGIDTLASQNRPLTISPTISTTGADAGTAFLESTNQSIQNEQTKIAEDEKAKLAQGESDITNLIKTLGTTGQMKEKAYQAEGVDAAKKQLDEYTSQLEAEQLANRRNIEQIRKNFRGSVSGATDEINRANRESFSKQADLAILQNASLRRYDTGRAIADRVVEMQLEPLRAELEAKKFIYENNKDVFTTAENRAFQAKITADERQYNAEKKRLDDIQNIKLEAAKNGAPVSVINAIGKATDTTEALKAAGQYSTDPLERAIKRQQLSNLQNEGVGAPKIVSVNGVDSIWDGTKYVPAPTGGAGAGDLVTIEKGIDEIDTIKKLASDKLALNASAGAVQRGNSLFNRNRINDWRASAGNILAKLTVSELARIKGTGVTFGALSEGERNAVAGAASVLNEAKIFKGEGENKVWTGRFRISEDLVKQAFNDIQKYAEIDFIKRTGYTPEEYRSAMYANTAINALEAPETQIMQAGY